LTLDEAGRAYVLGRSGNSEIRLDDVDLWRERVGLMRLADGVEVRDLGAQPPVTVNERRLHGPQTLREGDRLQLGETTLRYRNPAEAYLRRFEEEFPESLGAIEPPPGAPRAESVEARAPSAPVARAAPPNLDGHGGAPRSLSASVRVSLESAPRPRRSWSALQRTFLAVACLVCSATVTLLLWILSG
jgi:pSer/pThr/pTyr-binding forkhead associated (FHA) protein